MNQKSPIPEHLLPKGKKAIVVSSGFHSEVKIVDAAKSDDDENNKSDSLGEIFFDELDNLEKASVSPGATGGPLAKEPTLKVGFSVPTEQPAKRPKMEETQMKPKSSAIKKKNVGSFVRPRMKDEIYEQLMTKIISIEDAYDPQIKTTIATNQEVLAAKQLRDKIITAIMLQNLPRGFEPATRKVANKTTLEFRIIPKIIKAESERDPMLAEVLTQPEDVTIARQLIEKLDAAIVSYYFEI